MVNFVVGVRHFTWLYRGSIQGILAKNPPQRIKFTPGTLQKTVRVLLNFLSHTRSLGKRPQLNFMTQNVVFTTKVAFLLSKHYSGYLIQPSNTFQIPTRRLAFQLIWKHWEKRRRLNIKVASHPISNYLMSLHPKHHSQALRHKLDSLRHQIYSAWCYCISQWIQVTKLPAP